MSLSRQSTSIDDAFKRALALHQSGKIAEAEPLYAQIIKQQPDHASALHLYGVCHYQRGDHPAAAKLIEASIRLKPTDSLARNNHGAVLLELKSYDAALSAFDHAIKLNPAYAEAWNNRGNALYELGRHQEALACYETAIRQNFTTAQVYYNKGNALAKLKRREEAIISLEKSISLNPHFALAYYNLGECLIGQNRFEEAELICAKAVALNPEHAEAHLNLAIVMFELKRYDEARIEYAKSISLKPDLPYAVGFWLHTKMYCCDWDDLDSAYNRVFQLIENGKQGANPFSLLSLPSTLAQQQRCAQLYVKDKYPANPAPLWQGETYQHERIRVGYLSSDFCNHPMAYLIAEMIERHDRSRFETIALSFSPPTRIPIRLRLEQAFERFIDVAGSSDAEIASLARQLEIDIAIDLNGHTANARTSIFAMRPAPIQVSHLGYPGTMGAEYIDYIIADPTVIPTEHLPYYNERVAYLPDTYWFNDTTKAISDRVFVRAEQGLPDGAFVFCCFNNNQKITPDVFDIWARLLHMIDGSVLWLLESNAVAPVNLRRETEKRGIAPDRLIFAPRMEMADHLARHRLADLFLDTFHYNAHTTASDALWAGLPVLTCQGETFASRVAASMLNAIELPELITHSHHEYESLALELATQSAKLDAVRRKLATNRNSLPLFDTGRFTRHIESAYDRMVKQLHAGMAPEHITVHPLDESASR